MKMWSAWVADTVNMLDGDGTFRHWKFPGSMSEQPAAHFAIWKAVRLKWVELKNQEMKRKYGK